MKYVGLGRGSGGKWCEKYVGLGRDSGGKWCEKYDNIDYNIVTSVVNVCNIVTSVVNVQIWVAMA